jgi:hypothetical protein
LQKISLKSSLSMSSLSMSSLSMLSSYLLLKFLDSNVVTKIFLIRLVQSPQSFRQSCDFPSELKKIRYNFPLVLSYKIQHSFRDDKLIISLRQINKFAALTLLIITRQNWQICFILIRHSHFDKFLYNVRWIQTTFAII